MGKKIRKAKGNKAKTLKRRPKKVVSKPKKFRRASKRKPRTTQKRKPKPSNGAIRRLSRLTVRREYAVVHEREKSRPKFYSNFFGKTWEIKPPRRLTLPLISKYLSQMMRFAKTIKTRRKIDAIIAYWEVKRIKEGQEDLPARSNIFSINLSYEPENFEQAFLDKVLEIYNSYATRLWLRKMTIYIRIDNKRKLSKGKIRKFQNYADTKTTKNKAKKA